MKVKDIKPLITQIAGIAFTAWTLTHLILIALWGQVTIIEPNKLILYQEIITLTALTILSIHELHKK